MLWCTLYVKDIHMGGKASAIGGQGEGEGGDSHRLTLQNTVPLPKAIFDPPNSGERKFSRAPPSLMQQKHQLF